MSVMAGLSATVQVGDTARSERLLAAMPLGPLEGDDGRVHRRATRSEPTSVGLHRLQSATSTVRSTCSTRAARSGSPPRSTRTCTRRWRSPTRRRARSTRRSPKPTPSTRHDRATYLDRITAGIARGLALARRGDGAAATAVFDQVAGGGRRHRGPCLPGPGAPRRARPRRRPVGGRRRGAHGRRPSPASSSSGCESTGWRQAFMPSRWASPGDLSPERVSRAAWRCAGTASWSS